MGLAVNTCDRRDITDEIEIELVVERDRNERAAPGLRFKLGLEGIVSKRQGLVLSLGLLAGLDQVEEPRRAGP
jgi:hypothetical protein